MPGFLDVPAEIRNRIYFYTLVADPCGCCETGTTHSASKVAKPKCAFDTTRHFYYSPAFGKDRLMHNDGDASDPAQPSITKVCRQIRQETLPIFYGANNFRMEDGYWWSQDGIHEPFPALLISWLTSIRSHVHLFKSLRIECGRYCAQRAHEVICAITDLNLPFEEGVLDGKEMP